MHCFYDLTLPNKEFLDEVSFKSSYDKSLNKVSLTEDILQVILSDLPVYYNGIFLNEDLFKFDWRVKSQDSCIRKYHKALKDGKRLNSTFNDILGIRMRVDDYAEKYPEYFRIVDMRNGKTNDDGYRAMHLYYQKDNYHYQIEIQLWSNIDYKFNNWSHLFGYKYVDSDILVKLRDEYDLGQIKDEYDFRERMKFYAKR